MKTWVMVASAARARLFAAARKDAPLQEISVLVNPDDRLHQQEFKTDKPGRAVDSHGGQRHAMQTPVDPREQSAIRFAKRVLEPLEAGLNEDRFEALYLVASPHFLGLVREHMSGRLSRVVKGELAKDLTGKDATAIQEYVADLLMPA